MVILRGCRDQLIDHGRLLHADFFRKLDLLASRLLSVSFNSAVIFSFVSVDDAPTAPSPAGACELFWRSCLVARRARLSVGASVSADRSAALLSRVRSMHHTTSPGALPLPQPRACADGLSLLSPRSACGVASTMQSAAMHAFTNDGPTIGAPFRFKAVRNFFPGFCKWYVVVITCVACDGAFTTSAPYLCNALGLIW